METIFRKDKTVMAIALKDERIDFRANSNQKTLLERAAELKHVSLSSYVLTSSLKFQMNFNLVPIKYVPKPKLKKIRL